MQEFISQQSIYECSFEGAVGSEQKGDRIALIVQNNVGNNFSPTTWAIPITSQNKKELRTHHILYKEKYPFLRYDENTVLVEQLVTRDKCRLGRYIGKIDDKDFTIIIEKIIENLRRFKFK